MQALLHKGAFIAALLLGAPIAVSQAVDDAVIKARVALAVARFAEMPHQREPGPLRLCGCARASHRVLSLHLRVKRSVPATSAFRQVRLSKPAT